MATQNLFKINQTGQAMVEFIISMLVLIPVLLMIPLLGNYIDIKMATVSAARYQGWERTVFDGQHANWGHASKSDTQIKQEVLKNFYSDYNPNANPNSTPTAKSMWVDKSGASLLYPLSQGSKFKNSTSATNEANLLSTQIRTFNLALKTTSSIANLGVANGSTTNTSALVTSSLSVSTKPVPDITSGILANNSLNAPSNSNSDLVFGGNIGNHAILTDAWNASGPDNGSGSVKSVTTPMVPTAGGGSMAVLGGLAMSMMRHTPLSPIPSAMFSPGLIQPDIIPNDRKSPRP